MMTVLTHTHTQTHTHKNKHTNTHQHTRTNTHTHPPTHTPTPTHTYTHPHPHPHTHTSRRRRRCKCRRTHTRHAHLCSHAACCVHNTSTTRDHACAPVAPTNQLSTTSAGQHQGQNCHIIPGCNIRDNTRRRSHAARPSPRLAAVQASLCSASKPRCAPRRCPSIAGLRAAVQAFCEESLAAVEAAVSKPRCVPRRCRSLVARLRWAGGPSSTR